MKHFFLMSLVVLSASSSTLPGIKEVGNGGNAIICKNENGSFKSIEMLDYYEVRLVGKKLSLNQQLGSYKNMLNDLFTRWSGFAPVRMPQYKKWLAEFESEAGIYNYISIPSIPDTGTVAIPNGCELQPIAFQRPDREIMPGVKRYTISKDLWDLLPEIQKAGLVLHELVYREAILAAHTTSFPTRFLTGYLSSVAPNGFEYAGVVSQMPLLWTEYAGSVLVNIGTVSTNQTCQTCSTFQRSSSISLDGKYFNVFVTKIFKDLKTDDVSIEFTDKTFGKSLETTLWIEYDPTSFYVHWSIIDDRITTMSLKDQFHFVFSNLASFTTFAADIKFANWERGVGPLIMNIESKMDGAQSWYKNTDGSLIMNINQAGYGWISAIDKLWRWDAKAQKYVPEKLPK